MLVGVRVAVVGAGVTGLVAARELTRAGAAVDLYERWPDVAGQASAFDVGGGVWLDRYYHHLFESDAEMIRLHEELLPGELGWHRSSVGMFSGGRIWPFVSPRDLLTYHPLAPLDRLRLGAAVMRLVRRGDWKRMDDVAAAEWLRRACGERAYRAVWLPLLLGKFGDDAATVPLAWLWSKLTLRRRLDRRSAGRELLGYPRGSFRAICVALADDIRARGGRIHVDHEVLALSPDGGGWRISAASAGSYRAPPGASLADASRESRADAVVLTTPTHVSAALASWPEDYGKRLRAWRYRAAVVLLLELREPFSDTYWVNVAEPGVPFLGVIEHTNLVPAQRYPARYLYVSNYLAPSDPLARATADELLGRYLPALRRMSPGFGEHQLQRTWSFREDAAQPVPTLGNRARILPHRTPLAAVFVANTTQIYPEDRGTNYSARLGRDVARAVLGQAAA
ncbi:NAD(P)/FAD-dependent oxidoreductase [soil metagenome]